MQPKYLTWKERRSVRSEIKGGGGAVCVYACECVCWDGASSDETYSAV